MTKLTPYQKIMLAAHEDRGVLLRRSEVWLLAQDDAISRRAELDDGDLEDEV